MPDTKPYGQSSEPLKWTRIEMLLSLYQGANEQIELAIQATDSSQLGQAAVHRTRAAALVTAIRSGIDPQHGQLPVSIDQLCEFVQFCLAEGDANKMRSALKVMTELQEGFAGIRDDAVRMEQNGEIPGLPDDASVEVTC